MQGTMKTGVMLGIGKIGLIQHSEKDLQAWTEEGRTPQCL